MYATAGSLFLIGSARPDWNARAITSEDFVSEVWTPVAHVVDMGRIGGEWEMSDMTKPTCTEPDQAVFQQFRKGNRIATRMQIALGLAANDAGQIAIETAYTSAHPFAFKFQFADAAPGGTPSARLFIAFVEKLEDILEVANTVTGIAASLLLQSDTVRIKASVG